MNDGAAQRKELLERSEFNVTNRGGELSGKLRTEFRQENARCIQMREGRSGFGEESACVHHASAECEKDRRFASAAEVEQLPRQGAGCADVIGGKTDEFN